MPISTKNIKKEENTSSEPTGPVTIHIKGAEIGANFALYSHSRPEPITNGVFDKEDFNITVPVEFVGPAKLKVNSNQRTREIFPVNIGRDFFVEEGAVLNLKKKAVPLQDLGTTTTSSSKNTKKTTRVTSEASQGTDSTDESKKNFWDRFK